MKQIVVGVYPIGREDCQIVLREGNGAEFYNCPEKGSIPRIKIGADVELWCNVVSALLHEAMEFTLTRMGSRMENSYDMGKDASSYLFVLNHVQFSDACARVADCVTTVLPDLSKEWIKWKKGSKRTGK